jgi:hypothetical protein
MSTSTKSNATVQDVGGLFPDNTGGTTATNAGGSSGGGAAAGNNTITGNADPYGMLGLTQQNSQATGAPAQEINPSNPQDTGTPGAQTITGGSDPYGMAAQGTGASQQFMPTNYTQAGGGYGGGPANPYITQQASAITNAANKNLMEGILPQVNQGAVEAGGYGGARHGLVQGTAIGQAQGGLDSALATLYSGAYESDANRSLQGSIANGQLGLGVMNSNNSRDANLMNFYSQQRGLDQSGMSLGANLLGQGNLAAINQGSGIYGLGQQEYNAPWQAINNYNGILQPGYTLGGSQQTNGAGPSSGQSALGGAAAGATIGTQIMPGWGTAIGGLIGGVGGYVSSDRRLKTDIEKVGKLDDGLNVYKYRYKDGGPMHIGVMAQEVEKVHPEAVGLLGGFKAVNYGLLG